MSGSGIVKDSFKIIIIGESGVGKSALLSQFIHQKFDSHFVSTIGIDFGSRPLFLESGSPGSLNPGSLNPEPERSGSLKKYQILLKIFDTAGQKRFRTITEHYQSSNIDGVVVVVDITNVETFNTASQFIFRARELSSLGKELPIVLVGNKLDLAELRCVSHEKFERLATEFDVAYREISVKESLRDCESIFEIITRKIIDSRKEREENVVINIDTHKKARKKSLFDNILERLICCICK